MKYTTMNPENVKTFASELLMKFQDYNVESIAEEKIFETIKEIAECKDILSLTESEHGLIEYRRIRLAGHACDYPFSHQSWKLYEAIVAMEAAIGCAIIESPKGRKAWKVEDIRRWQVGKHLNVINSLFS